MRWTFGEIWIFLGNCTFLICSRCNFEPSNLVTKLKLNVVEVIVSCSGQSVVFYNIFFLRFCPVRFSNACYFRSAARRRGVHIVDQIWSDQISYYNRSDLRRGVHKVNAVTLVNCRALSVSTVIVVQHLLRLAYCLLASIQTCSDEQKFVGRCHNDNQKKNAKQKLVKQYVCLSMRPRVFDGMVSVYFWWHPSRVFDNSVRSNKMDQLVFHKIVKVMFTLLGPTKCRYSRQK